MKLPEPDEKRDRLVNFGMSLVYWSAAVVCLLVAISILTNLGSGEKEDSEYLIAAGLTLLFGLLLVWVGNRSYRNTKRGMELPEDRVGTEEVESEPEPGATSDSDRD